MQNWIKISFLILLSLVGCLTSEGLSQTPAPGVQMKFQIPVTDNTMAEAMFLPTQDGQTFLVYSTSAGKLGVYSLIQIQPGPQPNPPIPPQPVQQKLNIAIVEDPRTTTIAQKEILIDKEWRKLAVDKHNFLGLIPQDIIEKETGKPPASLLPFLIAAKGHNLPCVVIFNKSMSLMYAAELPNTATEMTAIIRKFGG